MYKEIQKTNYLKITLTVSLTIENAFKLKQSIYTTMKDIRIIKLKQALDILYQMIYKIFQRSRTML